jgi:phosphonopyruvate decarboxylase
MSALATIAVINPSNLAIVCIDNGHYGKTGYQKNDTSLGVDLEKSPPAWDQEDVHNRIGGRARRQRPQVARRQWHCFCPVAAQTYRPARLQARNMDPSACRHGFRAALLGAG